MANTSKWIYLVCFFKVKNVVNKILTILNRYVWPLPPFSHPIPKGNHHVTLKDLGVCLFSQFAIHIIVRFLNIADCLQAVFWIKSKGSSLVLTVSLLHPFWSVEKNLCYCRQVTVIWDSPLRQSHPLLLPFPGNTSAWMHFCVIFSLWNDVGEKN